CAGNVEGSALRRHVASHKGYTLLRTKRANGSFRVRLDLPYPGVGEKEISTYLKSGQWKFVICDSYEEASDFQWYLIERLKPLLNKIHKSWNKQFLLKYSVLLNILEVSSGSDYYQLCNMRSGPGVYVHYQKTAIGNK
ncbi:hypothetical protein L0337_17470, partial [candidate division KSB1 bacterium]|nr:hypothetical protein [candidate division KSB1 bacterium]